MKIIFFDFDGTITKNDSLLDFVQYAVGKPTYLLGIIKLSPILLAYILRLIPNHITKEKFIANFFKGWNVDHFQKIANRYSLEQIDKITRTQAIKKIKWHQTQGHKVVVVSASMECWLKAWCNKNDLDLIATRLEIKGNVLTGKFSTKNCYGIEKTNRIKEVYSLSDYDQIYVYGDSCGDKEMLSIAHKQYYKYFE